MDYQKALQYAKTKHQHQTRIGGAPYITHPIAVAEILKDLGYSLEYQIAGLFHDLLEDTDATYDEIVALGNERIGEAVVLVTKEKGYDMEAYMERIKGNEMALAVKLADRVHNLRCAVCAGEGFRRKYVRETEAYYLGLARGTGFEGMVGEALEVLIESLGSGKKCYLNKH